MADECDANATNRARADRTYERAKLAVLTCECLKEDVSELKNSVYATKVEWKMRNYSQNYPRVVQVAEATKRQRIYDCSIPNDDR